MKFPQRLWGLLLALFILIGSIPISARAAQNDLVFGIGFITASGLRLRKEPNSSSSIAATAQKNECVVVLAQEGDWYRVNYNLQEGYMYKDFLQVLPTENAELGNGKVNANDVNLRKGPGLSYPSVGIAPKDAKCYIIGVNNGWYKVIYRSDICYIRSDFLDLTEIPYENAASRTAPKYYRLGKSIGVLPLPGNVTRTDAAANTQSGHATGQQILSKATEYLGTPYVYGGASPSGFDCSGFVYYVLKCFGYSPYRTPADQFSMGTDVTSKAALQPGDIVFFSGTAGAGGISHVGIYAGNGQIIHAPNSRSVVSYADITSGYWAQHYYGARRVAN